MKQHYEVGRMVGGIKQIDVPQLGREEMPTGDALAAVPVTITSNYVLVGLRRGGSEVRNLDLIRTRAWFDIPMLVENGKPAKITFGKGIAGDKILGTAIQAWSTAANQADVGIYVSRATLKRW